MKLIDRLQEPSSWAGIGLLLSVIAPALGISSVAVDALVHAGTAVAGAAAIIMKEKSNA